MARFDSKNHSYKKMVIENRKLRYSSTPFLRIAVGTLFLIVGVTGTAICFAIVNAIFPIENNSTNNLHMVLFLGISVPMVIFLVANPLKKLFNKLFCKKVSLIDSDKETFTLKIEENQFTYRKNEIEKVRILRKSGKAAVVNQCTLSLKMPDRVFRFASDEKRSDLDELYEQLNEWKEKSEKTIKDEIITEQN